MKLIFNFGHIELMVRHIELTVEYIIEHMKL